MTRYLIGTDPELFLQDDKGNFVSAHNIIPGNKHQPHRVVGGAVQPDGTAAEFNTDPASSAEEFSNNIFIVLSQLQELVADRGLTLVATPTATFDAKYFKDLPAVAKAFGCTPDYNVWTQAQTNFKPTKKPFRTGAGHIHVGWLENPLVDVFDQSHLFDCNEAVKQLDASLYMTSLIWDTDTQRRTLYGKPGCFRPKPYGVEYRPLSNAYIADPDLHKFVFNTTVHSMNLLDENVKLWEDYAVQLNLEEAKAEEPITKAELLDYHDFLVRDYDFPELPKGYLEFPV